MKVKKLLLTHTTKNYYNVAPICPPYSPPSQHWPIQSPPYILVLYKFGFHLMITVLIQYTKQKWSSGDREKTSDVFLYPID